MSDDITRDLNKIPIQWYKRGLEFKHDNITKFMMHWIAFNWLYNSCRGSEKRKIERYCEEKIEYLSKYDAFSRSEYNKIKEKPDMISDRSNTESRIIQDYVIHAYNTLNNEDDIKALLLILYQIRCNLFHGSKRCKDSEDVELVRCASVILEGYLDALFKNDSEFKDLYKEIIGEHNNS